MTKKTTTGTEPLPVHIRWMLRRDMEEVLAIEEASFEFPWREEDFIRSLRQRNCIGMVAEQDGQVVGFNLYVLFKQRVELLNFAVAPQFRRRGVAAAMVSKILNKLTPQGRRRVVLNIRESNLPALCFFRQQGFRAVSVLRHFYDDTDEDAYVLEYRLGQPRINHAFNANLRG